MDNRASLSPNCVTASYTSQRLPQYKGNPLIEALPPIKTEESLCELFSVKPEFAPEQRGWSSEERLQMLLTLQDFMVPLRQQVELTRSVDSLLRAGYVGRAPQSPEHARIRQAIYDRQQKGETCSQTVSAHQSQLSSLLIGISGMGKTTTLKRWFSHIPQVIYHPTLHTYQVTYLHVEMPSDGSSVKGLGNGILQQMDRLIPGANYHATYGLRGNAGADLLMRSVSFVFNMHHLGFLVADEAQNLTNSRKGKQTVMTELVSACNDLHVPLLFVGTNKSAKLFGIDFRESRRASGHGIRPWERLPESAEPGHMNEWREFLSVLWSFQWVRKPVALDELLASTMYRYSQGVIDIAIKLFASAQARAIHDGSECLSAELITSIYNNEFQLVHPMIEALRDDDIERLALFDDVAPIGLNNILASISRRVKGKTSDAYSVKSSDPTYVPRLTTTLVAAGFGEQEALDAAEAVAHEGGPRNLLQGAQAALKSLTALRPVPRAKRQTDSEPPADIDYEHRPLDYRRAITAACKGQTSIFEQLHMLGMTRPLDELLQLN